MQEPTAQLQILIPRKVRNRLKAEAAVLELDMGTLGGIVLEYGLALVAGPEKDLPIALKKAITEAQRQKRKAEEQDKKD